MSSSTVTVTVPPEARHLAVLRTCIGGIAARDRFTIDQIDDLRMAVEEAATQLLRQSNGTPITMAVDPTADGLEVRLSAAVEQAAGIDPASFSWMILRALTDALECDTAQGRLEVRLRKTRLASDAGAGAADGNRA